MRVRSSQCRAKTRILTCLARERENKDQQTWAGPQRPLLSSTEKNGRALQGESIHSFAKRRHDDTESKREERAGVTRIRSTRREKESERDEGLVTINRGNARGRVGRAGIPFDEGNSREAERVGGVVQKAWRDGRLEKERKKRGV